VRVARLLALSSLFAACAPGDIGDNLPASVDGRPLPTIRPGPNNPNNPSPSPHRLAEPHGLAEPHADAHAHADPHADADPHALGEAALHV
jgi:hypothetical protein